MRLFGGWLVPGGLWLLLGLAKAAHPAPFHSYMESQFRLSAGAASSLVWGVVVLEVILGVALLSFGFASRRLRVVIVSTALVAALLPMCYMLLETPRGSCGCFGAIAEAGTWQRLVVSSVLTFFSAGLLVSIDRKAVDA